MAKFCSMNMGKVSKCQQSDIMSIHSTWYAKTDSEVLQAILTTSA
jgi:hypothetical protein